MFERHPPSSKFSVGDYVQVEHAEGHEESKTFIARVTQIPYLSEDGISSPGKARVTFMLRPHGSLKQIICDQSALKLVMAAP